MTNGGPQLPNQVAKRPLHFFWLLDTSGSMAGRKIAALNQAIRESLPAVQSALQNYPQVKVMMRVITFDDPPKWHIGPEAQEISLVQWSDLGISGATGTAQAINMLCNELDIEKMPKRGYPPVCLLVSDGYCTDPDEAYEAAIKRLNALPWGKKAVRLAIAIGDESEYDAEQLSKFINQEIPLLKAHNAVELVNYIKWASVSASVSSSVGKSAVGDANTTNNVHLPPPPGPVVVNDPGDVF